MDQVVVLIDDDGDLHELARETIKAHPSLRLIEAMHGPQGLAQLGKSQDAGLPIAVVLLDLSMPGPTGIEVLKTIRSDDRLRGVPVVIFTRSAAEADVWMSYKLRANAYVIKPGSGEQLVDVVNKTLAFWGTINVRVDNVGYWPSIG